jgi:hypothetical protein
MKTSIDPQRKALETYLKQVNRLPKDEREEAIRKLRWEFVRRDRVIHRFPVW